MNVRKSLRDESNDGPSVGSTIADRAEVDALVGAALRSHRRERGAVETDQIADRIVVVAAEVARSLGAPEASEVRVESPHRTLTDAIGAMGRPLDVVAESVGLTRTLLLRLARGLVDLETVPSRLVDYLAIELGTSVEQVRFWISRTPSRPVQASYHAMSVPNIPRKQSFRDAVASERDLPDDVMRERLGEEDATAA